MLSSPGLTGRSSNHRPWVLDCPVKPGNDTGRINTIENTLHGRPRLSSRLLRQKARIAPHRGGVYAHDLLQGETAQIVRTAGLRPGAGQAGAAERLGADHRADDVAIDIDIPGR